MKFGGKQTMKDKMTVATKRGYDTGKPSKDTRPVGKPKIKPKVGKKEVGVKATWKF